MPDRMSNIVLFETEEEVKAYKSVLGEGYKINVEAYVRYLQENFQIWRNTALKINRESL